MAGAVGRCHVVERHDEPPADAHVVPVGRAAVGPRHEDVVLLVESGQLIRRLVAGLLMMAISLLALGLALLVGRRLGSPVLFSR